MGIEREEIKALLAQFELAHLWNLRQQSVFDCEREDPAQDDEIVVDGHCRRTGALVAGDELLDVAHADLGQTPLAEHWLQIALDDGAIRFDRDRLVVVGGVALEELVGEIGFLSKNLLAHELARASGESASASLNYRSTLQIEPPPIHVGVENSSSAVLRMERKRSRSSSGTGGRLLPRRPAR
jgi:hypothetical protein